VSETARTRVRNRIAKTPCMKGTAKRIAAQLGP
jgi:hypothetical protein